MAVGKVLLDQPEELEPVYVRRSTDTLREKDRHLVLGEAFDEMIQRDAGV